MGVTYSPYIVEYYLDSEEMMTEYLSVTAQDPNPDVFLSALSHAAKARCMTQVVKDASLGVQAFIKLQAQAHTNGLKQ
jgi:DNA-binding phage protein